MLIASRLHGLGKTSRRRIYFFLLAKIITIFKDHINDKEPEPQVNIYKDSFSTTYKLLLITHFYGVSFSLSANIWDDLRIKVSVSLHSFYSDLSLYCQARVQVQGLSQISKRPGPGACSYNCMSPPPTTTQETFLSRITLKSLHV